MTVKDNTKRYLWQMVSETIPSGIDTVFHVEPRIHIYNLIISLLENDKITLKHNGIKGICKEWKSLLYAKYSYLN